MRIYLSNVEDPMNMGTCLANLHKKKPGGKKDQENKYSKGFTRVPNKKRVAKKSSGP